MTLCTVVFCFQSMLVISKFRGRELCIRQSWIKNKVHRTPVMNLFVSDEVRLLMVGMTADTHTGSDSFRNVIQTFRMTFLIRWSPRSRIWICILRDKNTYQFLNCDQPHEIMNRKKSVHYLRKKKATEKKTRRWASRISHTTIIVLTIKRLETGAFNILFLLAPPECSKNQWHAGERK